MAPSLPLPQAFNTFVISAVRASMDKPGLPAGIKNIQQNLAAFGRPLPTVPVEAIYERKGDDHETQHHGKGFHNRRSHRTRSGRSAASMAKAEGKGCSNATLKGTFADKDTGLHRHLHR